MLKINKASKQAHILHLLMGPIECYPLEFDLIVQKSMFRPENHQGICLFDSECFSCMIKEMCKSAVGNVSAVQDQT